MKKTIILCTILLLVAVVGVNAQSTQVHERTAKVQQATPTKTMVTPADNKVVTAAPVNERRTTAQQATPTKTTVTQTKTINSKTTATRTAAPVVKKPVMILPMAGETQKMGTHAPEPNDANFTAKFAEWQKNYPDEYKAYMDSQRNINNTIK